MTKNSLATIYRPKEFEDVVSQSNIVKILEQQLKTNNIKNCYLFCGPSGCGKAQPLDSNVLTPNGYVRMGDIKIGDKVINGKGKSTEVLGVFPQGQRDTYRISFNDKTSIEVADNHLNRIILVNTNSMKKEIIDIETTELIELFENKKYSLRLENTIVDCWKDENIDIDPYLLGCLIGDGSLSSRNFGFSNTEKDILDKVNTILDRDYEMYLKPTKSNCDYAITFKNIDRKKYSFSYKNHTNLSYLQLQKILIDENYPKFDTTTLCKLSSGIAKNTLKRFPELKNQIKVTINKNYRSWNEHKNILLEQLKKYKLNCKSIYKYIPKNYLMSSVETRLQLLRGLIDTDGYACREYTTSSKQLAEDFAFLTRSLGIRVTMKIKKNVKYRNSKNEVINANDSYRFYIHADNSIRIFSSKKMDDAFVPVQQPPIRKIVSIDYIGKKECQCIYVKSPDHTYITDNFVITHNTTIARILANKINNGFGQPIEIDAASNSGVDNVRNLIDSSSTKSINSEYKIYICDECHSFSNQAWQAFLKTLEEPNSKCIFMFCTTDVQKVPQTILNRVQRFDLSKIPFDKIYNRLVYICNNEHFVYEEEGLKYIVKLSKGRMRDAITSLEKVSSLDNHITLENVVKSLNTVDFDLLFDLTNGIIDRNDRKILEIVDLIDSRGIDFKVFINDYANFILDINKYIILKNFNSIDIPLFLKEKLDYTLNIDNADKFFIFLLNQLVKLKDQIRYETDCKSNFEMMLLSIVKK